MIATCLLLITVAPQSLGQAAQSAQSRLYALLSLENEIEIYVQAQNWTDLQRSLEPGKWEQLAQTALSIWQNVTPGANQQYEIVNGTIKYKPPEDEADRPAWQDGDTEHLNTLLAEIRYDAKRLGLDVTTIGPNAQGTKAILTRLIGRINAERDNAVRHARDESTKAASDAKRTSSFKEQWDKWSKCDDQKGMCKYNCVFGPQPAANVANCISSCSNAFQCGAAPVAK
jgi:hypothetical protein